MHEFKMHMTESLTIELWRIPVVMLSALGIYVAFLLLIKLFGSRVMSRMTAFDAVVVVMFGAVAGRVILGHPPTLAAGVIGLATLMILEAIFGAVRRFNAVRRTFDARPQVVFAQGQMIERQLKKTHLSRSDIRLAIRRAGIQQMADVQGIILEPTGDLSVYRMGQPIDPELLKGVVGKHFLM